MLMLLLMIIKMLLTLLLVTSPVLQACGCTVPSHRSSSRTTPSGSRL
jgi:hypothetical protein